METEELVKKITELTDRNKLMDTAQEFIEGWWSETYTDGFIEGFIIAYGLGLQDGIDIEN